MKNDEIRAANRKALPKFLLLTLVGAVIGGVTGYCAARYGLDQLSRRFGERERILRHAHRPMADGGSRCHHAGGLHSDVPARQGAVGIMGRRR